MAFGATQHQVKVFMALTDAKDEWQDPREVESNTGVCLRTCHRHLEGFVATGIAEKRSIFPKHYYRLVDQGDLTDGQMSQVEQLQTSAAILGLT